MDELTRPPGCTTSAMSSRRTRSARWSPRSCAPTSSPASVGSGHHGVFQQHYYGRQTGEDPDARERHRGHEWFDDCAEFCELYDQNCFDPAYDSLPLERFEPVVREVFAEPRYLERG